MRDGWCLFSQVLVGRRLVDCGSDTLFFNRKLSAKYSVKLNLILVDVYTAEEVWEMTSITINRSSFMCSFAAISGERQSPSSQPTSVGDAPAHG